MKNISRFITYEEATISQTAVRKKISNIPSDIELLNMEFVALNIFDKVREHFGVPLRVSSFYRSPKLNKAVGGAKTSQHMKGEAIDMQGTGKVTNAMIFEFVKNNLKFDQLIWEFGTKTNPAWVHVSLSKSNNRNKIIFVK